MSIFKFVALCLVSVLPHSSVSQAEDTTCVFSAKKINSLSGAVNTDARPFNECKVYVFWASGTGANRVYHHFNNSPASTDASGVCDYKFTKDATYYLYFSGKELAANELAKIKSDRSALLLPLLINETQPGSSKFVTKISNGKLACELAFSLPLYISRLQKIEAKLSTTSSKDILTKVRKLSYNDAKWDQLIPRQDIEPFFKFDENTGAITAGEIPVPMAEAVSYIYKRATSGGNVDPNKFYLDGDGDRLRTETFDYVSASDGSTIQIGHVLTGIESQLFSADKDRDVRLATWAGDLGQAAWLVAKKSAPQVPTAQQWEQVWKNKARLAEIAGDIVGSGMADPASAAISSGTPLSVVIEDLFQKDWRVESIEAFTTRYEIDSIQTPNADTTKMVKEWTANSALLFSTGQWALIPANVRENSVLRASGHLFLVLIKMQQGKIDAPDPT
jgi:hypothetical protein